MQFGICRNSVGKFKMATSNSGKPKVHIVDVDSILCDRLESALPSIELVRIPVEEVWKPPDVSRLADLGEVQIFVGLSWYIPQLMKQGYEFPNLKWCHNFSAGVDPIVDYFNNTQKSPTFVITRSYVSAEAVSEYVIGQILATRRRFSFYHDNQKTSTWIRSAFQRKKQVEYCLSVKHSTVVILGVGRIGSRVASLCHALGMTVHGVKRTPVEKGQGSPHVNQYRTTVELGLALSEGDYIVNTLPSTKLTKGLLDNDVLQACQQKRPVFINVGRGDVISCDSIIKAMRSEWLSGAVLDVFPVEPLPQDSPLWAEPGVTITPHIAMDVDDDVRLKAVTTFVEYYNQFVKGQLSQSELINIERGY